MKNRSEAEAKLLSIGMMAAIEAIRPTNEIPVKELQRLLTKYYCGCAECQHRRELLLVVGRFQKDVQKLSDSAKEEMKKMQKESDG
ncbi:MAG: hypothetical protein V3T23_09405 [Nitrososphaerales archaeon]